MCVDSQELIEQYGLRLKDEFHFPPLGFSSPPLFVKES
jgi:hypothetical protein